MMEQSHTLFTELMEKRAKLAVVGLGYVGMPLAVEFAKKFDVIGFDVNPDKIALYQCGVDPTNEVGDGAIRDTAMHFTSDEKDLQKARFFIVAVPTPTYENKLPDLRCIESATELIGRNLQPGSVVSYESTVYPGVTEDICIPILERCSGLCCGKDFKIGYSPERINPGDKVHTVTRITKIVSGCDAEALDVIARVYEQVVEAGVYRAPCMKVAEAAKLVENSQRDTNVAFVNEVAMVLGAMGIDTRDVLAAMDTKWNALKFRPGLVGGHCIAVDPYYFVDRMNAYGINSHVITSSRSVNESMGNYVADQTIRQLILTGKPVKGMRAAVLGITFKENCPDTRNTKVIDIIEKLAEMGIEPVVADPWAEPAGVAREFGVTLTEYSQIHDVDCVILAVSHREFTALSNEALSRMFRCDNPAENVIIDVKSVLDKDALCALGYRYWRL